jgi:hypothetical protein
MVHPPRCGSGGEGGSGAGAARTGEPVERQIGGRRRARIPDPLGPGYRVYCERDGEVLVILLTGGTKQRQQRDIETAKASWADYKRRRPRAK